MKASVAPIPRIATLDQLGRARAAPGPLPIQGSLVIRANNVQPIAFLLAR